MARTEKKLPDLPDTLDLRLLELLQLDARTPVAQLAETIGLSAAACYRRVKQLYTDRVIERDMAVVSAKTMGWPLTMIVLVTLERERPQAIEAFIRRIRHVPEIIDMWYVTGEYDFALQVIARSMESYEQMTRDVFYAEEDLKGFKTLICMRRLKALGAIPAAASD